MTAVELAERVRMAHGDAWQVEGRLRAPYGGGATEVRGARLMASGIPTPKWNNADIVSPDPDVAAMKVWYDDRGMPWGVRVPLSIEFDLGEPLFEKRCAGLARGGFVPAAQVAGVAIRRATPADLESYVMVDAVAFRGDPKLTRAWVTPALGADRFGHWLADAAGQPIGVAMTVRSDGPAGPAAYLSGVAVVPEWRGRGVEPALSSRAIAEAFESDATLVHFNPDEEEIGWLLPLGFVEVPGFLVRVVRTQVRSVSAANGHPYQGSA